MAYGERDGDVIGTKYYFGNEGNDYIVTSHDSDGSDYVYGGAGHDRIVQGDYNVGYGDYGFLVGNAGDDKIYGGDYDSASVVFIYGDSVAYDDTLEEYNDGSSAHAQSFAAEFGSIEDYGELSWRRDVGDDVIKGGDYITGNLIIAGGQGDDKIWTGSDSQGGYMYIYGDNRAYSTEEEDLYYDDFYQYGAEGDGDDIIDVGDNPEVLIYIMGQGGNDKIIGSLQGDGYGSEYLFGGNGDDKIWAHNPG